MDSGASDDTLRACTRWRLARSPVISDEWVQAPRKAPYRCRRTGQDSPSAGPYYEESLGYCEAPGDDRELTLYHSPQWIRTMCEAPGSPLHVTTAAEHEATRQHLAHLEAELEAANNRVDELEAENDLMREAPAVDVDALAQALIIPLGNTFARKTGRPPKAAA